MFPLWISESTDESEVDKTHCLNNSVSSGTYSDYSPSQASSGSSNTRVKVGSLQTTAKDAVHNSLWGNRCVENSPFYVPKCSLSSTLTKWNLLNVGIVFGTWVAQKTKDAGKRVGSPGILKGIKATLKGPSQMRLWEVTVGTKSLKVKFWGNLKFVKHVGLSHPKWCKKSWVEVAQ